MLKNLSDIKSLDGANQPYDPLYDPLVDKTPGHGRDYAPTYWVDTVDEVPRSDGVVDSDMEADVVIIGSGFTGLSTAIHLARDHGVCPIVLEANAVSWGCSTRSGGQAQCTNGRLKRSQWIKRWGVETALKMHQECLDGMQTFKELIGDIDCDPQPGGHLYIAHRDRLMPVLEKEAKLLNETFDYAATILDAETLKRKYVNDRESAGAMHEPEGIGVHPAKLALGYLKKAQKLGVKVYTRSPVTAWHTQGGLHYLKTPGGVVKAKTVGISTGGYTSQNLHPELKNRLMPILSNSIVTCPLTEQEIEQCNFLTKQVITDTRVLRHYYRLLPDNRVQIGSRSAITGRSASEAKHEQLLINNLQRKFPVLKGIKIDYSWWGWVDVSHDMMPRIFQPNPKESIYYAMGYGGNGVMYSAQAGKRLAQWMAGAHQNLNLPIFQSKLPYPQALGLLESQCFSPFRRLGQRFLYRWYYLRDERA
ncbi:MAG: NAD(P)/FAD-dependent oxidoreductase [Ostreibacterium sp.]